MYGGLCPLQIKITMGDHYIPQYYLRGFCDPSTPTTISRYEKGKLAPITTNIRNVAQETGFYSTEVEKYLNEQIETPANPVLEKICRLQQITIEDKFILSTYMVTMLKRVPQSKVRMKRLAPEVTESVFSDVDKALDKLLESNPSKSEIIAKRRAEAKRLRQLYENNIPKEIWLKLILPDTAASILAILNTMTWRFLLFEKESAFLTSDNPIFFDEGLGIGRPESEITFPISRNIVLWATWRKDLEEGYFPTSERIVREINNRTASIATKYIFFAHEEKWPIKLINKSNFSFHRMI